MKRKYFGRILLYGSAVLVLFGICAVYSEILYWMNRLPRDIDSSIRDNVNHINNITNAVDRYYEFNHKTPASLECMVNDPIGRQSWIQITTDPWGYKIGYRVTETRTNISVKVWSYGSDNKPGGKWAAADVVRYWSPPVTNQIPQ